MFPLLLWYSFHISSQVLYLLRSCIYLTCISLFLALWDAASPCVLQTLCSVELTCAPSWLCSLVTPFQHFFFSISYWIFVLLAKPLSLTLDIFACKFLPPRADCAPAFTYFYMFSVDQPCESPLLWVPACISCHTGSTRDCFYTCCKLLNPYPNIAFSSDLMQTSNCIICI